MKKSKFCMLATVAPWLGATATTLSAPLAMQRKPPTAFFHPQAQTAVAKKKSLMTEVTTSR